MASEKVTTFAEANFQSAVLQANKPVLVDFWAAWCGPCKMIAPVVDEIAHEFDGKLIVGKLNVDENNSIAAQYGVMSIPTLLLFKNGKEIDRIVGYKTKSELSGILNSKL
ncbi:thioredoxin [Candidatus Formimonas warabiya]|uniref:Thioredoxin n=1 Tax=Formimonas warabiya TaxID=1761012 RepID=A0A3G1KNC8_FORW1|nr:thioredoxin [Candidatus Formimonas warabiya]ATW23969.1 thioredoxin [Candidatus Formimonas warabiya]